MSYDPACDTDSLNAHAGYFRKFRSRVINDRIPISGSIELTRKCNFSCIHCYLGPPDSLTRTGKAELSTERIETFLEETASAGTLFLLITGGEPLLRPDFQRIYIKAKTLGLLPTIFTNGSLVSAEHVELFKQYPPRAVEITLYGATPLTYEKITGKTGAFETVISAIDSLRGAGINVKLKSVMIKPLVSEFSEIEKIAIDRGLHFRLDSAIFPAFDGNREVLSLRVPPETAVAYDLQNPERLKNWTEFFHRQQNVRDTENLYVCGAGRMMFHLTANDRLKPCLMMKSPCCDLSVGRSFTDAWKTFFPLLKSKKAPQDSLCSGCEKKSICGYCPAFSSHETGSEEARSEYLCKLGNLRYNIIMDNEKLALKEAAK